MRRRKSIAGIFPIFLLTLAFAFPDWCHTAWAAEPDFALVVRGEEGREIRLSMGEIAKLPRVSVRAKDEKG